MTRYPNSPRAGTLAAIASIAALALALSCATPPKAVEAPPTPAPAPTVTPAPAPAAAPAAPTKVETAAVAAPDELRSKASTLRKKAFDLGLKDILPEDYSAADGVFAEGVGSYGKDNASSAASFTDASARFEKLISKGLPILAANEKKHAEALRATAVGKGAAGLFPELFSGAEAKFAVPVASEASGDFEAAANGYRTSSKVYEVLYKLCDADTARKAIIARDFAKWDPSNWTLAETRFAASQDLLPKDAPAAATSVDEAIQRYGIAHRTALEYYAGDRKRISEEQKAKASGIKAEVAVREEFAAALALHSQAESAQAALDFEASASLYVRASADFALAYDHAKAKMDAAKVELDSLDAAFAEKGIE